MSESEQNIRLVEIIGGTTEGLIGLFGVLVLEGGNNVKYLDVQNQKIIYPSNP
jgi:hypothetical protein